MTSTIRIGNGAGFWGDNLEAPQRLVAAAQLDYLTLEYLAELTMSILAHLKSREAEAGYVTDFPTVVESLYPALLSQERLRIVTNAGGMHPAACARRVAQGLAESGLGDTRIATVAGDDLLPRLEELTAAGETFANLESGEPLDSVRQRVVCANAYLGSAGIVEALAEGARIVITGRVADASLTVGPAMHEFGWKRDDWQRLAAATVAGHLIECGAQVTGGMYSDWTSELPLHDVGYPIAELNAAGESIITKPANTGGAVTVGTVSEQLVYEIGDPAHYLTPDVDADFTQVTLQQDGPDRVRVRGASGNPPPERYKVSLAYRDGCMASGTLVVAGPNARARAEAAAEIIRRRLERAGALPERFHVEYLGCGDSVPGVWPAGDPPEIVLRVSGHDPSRDKLERMARELAPLVTSGPPGVTGYTGPRVKPHPVLAYWPTTVSRERVAADVLVRSAREWAK